MHIEDILEIDRVAASGTDGVGRFDGAEARSQPPSRDMLGAQTRLVEKHIDREGWNETGG
jgi:hypothetical protein